MTAILTLENAITAHQSGDLVVAEKLYQAVLEAQPDRADARFNLGLIYAQLQRLADAVREISLAVQAKPDFGQGWLMLAECADAIDQQTLHYFAAEQATRLLHADAKAWFRLGLACNRLERDAEALTAYGRVVELDPNYVKAWVNVCVTSKAFGLYTEAESAIRQAFVAAGENVDGDENTYSYLHWHLALLELTRGDYPNGFAHFRARFRGGTNWHRFENDKPLWRGEDLRGKKILVMIEQGFGDALMLARYLPLLKDNGAHVLFQVHDPLMSLFKNWDGADEVIPHSVPITVDYDYHCGIFDLPYVFDTKLETVPAFMPYLPVLAADEETSLPHTENLKIGIVWAGQPDNIRGKNRSIPLHIFASIFSCAHATFFSLTRDKRAGDAEVLKQLPVIDLSNQLHDFAVTAKFISQLDLVITCDTGVAHLAGGMGKPVWVLLPYVADWRWGTRGDTTPWYPTTRLFRQTQIGVWEDVVADVSLQLSRFS